MGHRGSGSIKYSRELTARARGNIVLKKGMGPNIGQYTPVFLPGEPSNRKAWWAIVQRVTELNTTEATLYA